MDVESSNSVHVLSSSTNGSTDFRELRHAGSSRCCSDPVCFASSWEYVPRSITSVPTSPALLGWRTKTGRALTLEKPWWSVFPASLSGWCRWWVPPFCFWTPTSGTFLYVLTSAVAQRQRGSRSSHRPEAQQVSTKQSIPPAFKKLPRPLVNLLGSVIWVLIPSDPSHRFPTLRRLGCRSKGMSASVYGIGVIDYV